MRVIGMMTAAEFKARAAQKESASPFRDELIARLNREAQALCNWLRDNPPRDGLIVLPLPPSRTNGRFSRAHWTVESDVRTAFKSNLFLMLQAGLIAPPPPAPWQHIDPVVTFFVGAENDTDNLAGRAKWNWDWLVSQCYIAGDTPRHIAPMVPQQVVKRGSVYRMEIQIVGGF